MKFQPWSGAFLLVALGLFILPGCDGGAAPLPAQSTGDEASSEEVLEAMEAEAADGAVSAAVAPKAEEPEAAEADAP